MTKDDLMSIHDQLGAELDRRKRLGGYSMEADGLMIICSALTAITSHLIETYPKHAAKKSQ